MNGKENENVELEDGWSICALKTCVNPRVNLLGPSNIVLEYVKAHNVELLVRLGKHSAKISLNGVPVFLVDAFSWLEKNDAFRIDGIFRKEGNANRLKNAWEMYCGLTPIHEGCNAHDVCSLIKRFFREIKTPIFTENQMTILKFAESLRGTILIDAILSVIERLPSSHFSTIAFLMKQLKKISEYSSENQMNVENLATVFAPSLFRDDNLFDPTVKKKRDMQFRLMNFVRSRNGLQVLVVKTLIEKAHLIGSVQEHHFQQQPYCVDSQLKEAQYNTIVEEKKQEQKDVVVDEKEQQSTATEVVKEKIIAKDEKQRIESTYKYDYFEKQNDALLKTPESVEIAQMNEVEDEKVSDQEQYIVFEDKENRRYLASSYSSLCSINAKTESKGDLQIKTGDFYFSCNYHEDLLNSAHLFPRKTREYKSNKEMICTYCDMRGHLCKACPNV